MIALLVLVAVASGGHALVVGVLAWLVRHAPPAPAPLPEASLPDVVVAVAARDEEATLARCLGALVAQDYPPERLTVVVADDHSADATAVVAHRFLRRPALAGAAPGDDPGADPAGPDVRYLRVPDPVNHLRGKAQALHAAIAATTAPVILVTDADCAPPPGWVRATVAHLADASLGIVCGMSRIEARAAHPFDRGQALDWAFMIGATSGLAEAGLPATGMGNNMAIRRAAYEAVGGYPALPFSVTEDFTLVRAISETPRGLGPRGASPRGAARPEGGRWGVRIPLARETTVWTLPADGLGHAYAQRRRWARGGLGGGPAVWAAYVGLFAAHVAPLLALAASPWLGGGLAVAGTAGIAAMAAADAALLAATLGRTGPPLRAADLWRGEAFRWFYLVTLPAVLVLRPRVGWKGRRH